MLAQSICQFGFTEVHELLKHLKVVGLTHSVQLQIYNSLFTTQDWFTRELWFLFLHFQVQEVKLAQMVQAVQMTPEVTCIHHEAIICRRLLRRTNGYLGKRINFEASQQEHKASCFFQWLAQSIRYNRKEVEHECLI